MSYENFAYYYDSLMDEQFYHDYYKFINEKADFKTVLELGCGTGRIRLPQGKRGRNDRYQGRYDPYGGRPRIV